MLTRDSTCIIENYSIFADKTTEILLPPCLVSLAEMKQGIIEADLGKMIRFSKRDFTRITSSPKKGNIGKYSVSVFIKD